MSGQLGEWSIQLLIWGHEFKPSEGWRERERENERKREKEGRKEEGRDSRNINILCIK